MDIFFCLLLRFLMELWELGLKKKSGREPRTSFQNCMWLPCLWALHSMPYSALFLCVEAAILVEEGLCFFMSEFPPRITASSTVIGSPKLLRLAVLISSALDLTLQKVECLGTITHYLMYTAVLQEKFQTKGKYFHILQSMAVATKDVAPSAHISGAVYNAQTVMRFFIQYTGVLLCIHRPTVWERGMCGIGERASLIETMRLIHEPMKLY